MCRCASCGRSDLFPTWAGFRSGEGWTGRFPVGSVVVLDGGDDLALAEFDGVGVA